MADPYFASLSGNYLAAAGVPDQKGTKPKADVTQEDLAKPADMAEPEKTAPLYITPPPAAPTEEQKKAEDPFYGITFTPQDVEKANDNHLRVELGIAGYKTQSAPLTEQEQRASDAVRTVIKEEAQARQKVYEEAGNLKLEGPIGDDERRAIATHLWTLQIQNPTVWRSLNYAQKALMVEYQLNENKEWNRLRDKFGAHQDWFTALRHGAWSVAKGTALKGTVGNLIGVTDTLEANMKLADQNKAVRDGVMSSFIDILNQFKADPKVRDAEKVDRIYKKFVDEPSLIKKASLVKDPAIMAEIQSLNSVEQLDLFIRLNHKKGKDEFFGKDRPPLKIDDFDLDMLDKSWDPKTYQFTKDQDQTRATGAAIGGSFDPSGLAGGINYFIARDQSLTPEVIAGRKELYEERPKRLKDGKIDPLLFALDNMGRGAFKAADKDHIVLARAAGAAAYGSSFGKIEGALAGVTTIGMQVFGAGEDPDFWWNHLKASIYTGGQTANIAKMVSWYDAALNTNQAIEEWNNGGKSQIGARLWSMVDPNTTTEEAQALFRKYGALNSEFINVGFMQVNPASLVGRGAVLSGAAMREGMGVLGGASQAVKFASEAGIISIDRMRRINIGLYKFGSKVEAAEAAAFGAPVKVLGAVTLGTGKTMVYATGGAVQLLTNAAVKVAEKIAPEALKDAAKTGAVLKGTLAALGVTSAFRSFNLASQLAAFYGVGKAAEAVGGLLYKYGYRGVNLNGRGFQGALALAAEDATLSPFARTIARAGNVLDGIPAAAAYDITKGAWHGGGVGFGLGYLQDGARGGVNGFWGGVGMGGAGASHGVFQMYRSGIYTHSMAENELRLMIKDAPSKQNWEDLITIANNRMDWNLLPIAVGAIKMAGNHNIKIHLFNEAEEPNLGVEILREDRINPSDFIVTGVDAAGNPTRKEYLIPAMKNAARNLREKAEQLSRNAKTEQDFAAAEAATKAADKAEIDLHREFNEWLSDVRINGTAEQKLRVRSGTTLFRGLHIDGGVGNGVIYLNSSYMKNTTLAHEVFHGVQRAIARSSAINYCANTMFGIKLLDGKLVAQDGAISNLGMLHNFSELYNEILNATPHGADQATKDHYDQIRKDASARLKEAFDIINMDPDQAVSTYGDARISAAHETLRQAAEEFGAHYFESFLERKKPDYLFRNGKYAPIRRVLNSVEEYLDLNLRHDLEANGIDLNVQSALSRRRSAEYAETISKIENIRGNIARINERLDALKKITNTETGEWVYTDKELADRLERKLLKWKEDVKALHRSLGKTDTGDVFRDSSGAYLVVPALDKTIRDIVERSGEKKGSNALDLNGLNPDELKAYLTKAGLEHWLDPRTGKLKPQEQINAESVQRGKKAFDILSAMPSAISGVIVHTDEFGTRASGILTQEAINALVQNDAILPIEAKNAMSLLEAIKSANGISVLGGTEVNILYNGLSHESYDANGNVQTARKPKNVVNPTHRKIVPYRLDMVLTTKDANGNKVDPHYQMMVTAMDLEVLMRRGAKNFNASYTLPSGKVIKASDLFGGSFEVFKHHLQNYLIAMSQDIAPAGSDVFGGGETGEAIRDIMNNTVGAISTNGKDNAGNPMLIRNNPIISPLEPAKRGPDFVFTTFRVDLMSDLSVGSQRWSMNERRAYPRFQQNYSAVSWAEPVQKKGGLTEIKGVHEFERLVDEDTGETESVKVNYAVYQKEDGKYYIRANDKDVGVNKKFGFNSPEEAKRFAHLASQRHMLAAKNALSSTFVGGDKGIIVSNIEGNYLLIDTTQNSKIISERIYRNEVEAVLEATRMHNQRAIDNFRTKSNEAQMRVIEFQLRNRESAGGDMEEALPPRLHIGKGGKLKFVPVQVKSPSGKNKQATYSSGDQEVKLGLAKVGDKKFRVEFQKVGYNLMNTLIGDQTLRMDSPVVQRFAEIVAGHMSAEAIQAVGIPEVKKALGWYRNMVKNGHSVFGSMYGLFTESIGATSARTDVEQNFAQAEEALAMFSQGKYEQTLARIHSKIIELNTRLTSKNANGVSLFETEARDMLRADKAYKKTLDEFSISKDEFDMFDFFDPNSENRGDISKEALLYFEKTYEELRRNEKKEGLSQKQLGEAIHKSLSKIFRDPQNLMLRSNGKKYNANTVKVGQVMYGMWRQLTDGPKTPNFAGNLEGAIRDATIDVWAARTLHRIINDKILGREKWRLLPSMEKGVDYAWHDHGTPENPNVQVGGDFGFGQEVFKKTAEKLRDMHPEFKDVTPDDLQALMWFFEKGYWAERGWTEYAGAEMSSFENPLWRFAGTEDPSGIESYSNIRRIIAGVTGSYGPESLRIKANGEPIDLGAVARNQAQPEKVIGMVRGAAKEAFGDALRAANITQTYGLYGGQLEHSVSFDTIAHRGRFTALENALAKINGKRADALAALNDAAEKDRVATGDQKQETSKKLSAKRKTFEKHDADFKRASAELASERDNPTKRNQLGTLAEGLIEIARNYMQKDVMVSEVVGENHPNARPALDIMFQRPLRLDEVQALSGMITNDAGGLVGGFTFIPEPRNPNGARLERLTRIYENMKVNGKIPDSRKSQADQIKAEIEKLSLFKGIQSIANPEQMYRYRQYNDLPEIRTDSIGLMTESGARSYMRSWAAKLREIIPNYESYQGNTLTTNEYFVSTDTINSGGYDTFVPTDIGADRSLGDRLSRYKQTLEREAASYTEQERGLVGSADSTAYTPDRTSWLPTESDQAADASGKVTLYTPDEKQTIGGKTPNLVVTPEQAADWVRNAFKAPFANSESGIAWGDRHYTIYQKRNPDGSMSNEFRVIGAYDRKATVVQGKEAAMQEVTARLTGQKTGAGGERTITVNGVKFTVTEGMRPVVGPEGKALPESGAFEKESQIWSFSAVDPFEATQQLQEFGSYDIARAVSESRAGRVFSHRTLQYLDHLNKNIQSLSDGNLELVFKIGSPNAHRGDQKHIVHTGTDGTQYKLHQSDFGIDTEIWVEIKDKSSGSSVPIRYSFGHQDISGNGIYRIVTEDPNTGKLTPLNAHGANQTEITRAIAEATRELRRYTDDTYEITDFNHPSLTDPAPPTGGRGYFGKEVPQRFRTNGKGDIVGSVGDRVSVGSANVLDGGLYYLSKTPEEIFALAPDAFTGTGTSEFLKELKEVFDFDPSDPHHTDLQTGKVTSKLGKLQAGIRKAIQEYADFKAGVGSGQLGSGVHIRNVKDAKKIATFIDRIERTGRAALYLAQRTRIQSNWSHINKFAELLKGAGTAINSQNAAILHATGLGTPETRGINSYIVNKTGAVFKTREKAYGAGNTIFAPHDSSSLHPRAGMPTRDINEAIARTRQNPETLTGGETSDIRTHIDPKRAYSAASHIELERAFNSEPDKFGWTVASAANGGLFSDRARSVLPKNIEIHTKVDESGNIRVRAIDSNNHNWSESVAKKDPATGEPIRDADGMLIWEKLPAGQRVGEDGVLFEFSLGIGRKWGKEGTAKTTDPLPKPTGDATIEGAWRVEKDPTRNSWDDDLDVDLGNGAVMEGEVFSYFDKRKSRWITKEPHGNDPKIESAVIAEVTERLRQSGMKRIAWDKFGSTAIYDQIREALGAGHTSERKGWETEEPVWKIDPKKAYSAADPYGSLPDHMKALSDEYTQILSKYGMTKRKILTGQAKNVRQDVMEEGNVNTVGGEAYDRQTQRDVVNISPDDLNRLKEITGEFAKYHGYHTKLSHASRSKNLEGPMSGKYSDMGVALHAGIQGEPYQIGSFGEYRHPFRARGEFFDLNNSRHRDMVEQKIDQMIKEGRWIKDKNGMVASPAQMAKIYRIDSTAGAMATLVGNGGMFHNFERLGLHTNFTDGLRELGFTGYKEREATRDWGDLPHAAILGSENAKIADPITFDSSGKVIPIHERFNRNNPDPRYSPVNNATPEGFVSYDRLFNEDDATSSLYSNKAKAALTGWRMDLTQIKDEELRQGMDDAPMGMNTLPDLTNPMSIISLTQKGKKESSIEFYLMVNRQAEEGRPQNISRMAVLQMSKKKGDVTIEPIVGALSEIIERLKMTGVTQVFVPKKPWPEMAISQRDVADKLRKQAEEMGAEHDIPDSRTIVDEHDGLRIVMGDNSFGKEVTMQGGKTLMYTIDRKKQYSPAIDLKSIIPTDRNASPVTDPTENPEGFLYHASLASLDDIRRRGLRSNAFVNAYDPETGEYLDSDGIEDPSRQVIWFSGSESESADTIRYGHKYQFRIKESKVAEYADLIDAEREGSGSGIIAEGASKGWSIRPEFLEYREISQKNAEPVGDWKPVAGPPSKKKGKPNGK